jgi:hypothetical protein
MTYRSKIVCLALPGILFLSSTQLYAQSQPRINDKYPIRSGKDLSPPIVSPVGECAKAVHVSGYLPHAIVKVFAHVTEQIGIANPYFAEADIPLTRELKAGESITATQEALGKVSAQSADPTIVGTYPATLNKPVVDVPIFACGRIVPADHLNAGTHVSVFHVGVASPIGEADATQSWQPVLTSSLVVGASVFAKQVACPDIPSKKKEAQSDPVVVSASPAPVPPPVVEPPPIGADAVVMDSLLVGSEVAVSQNGGVIGGGFSTAGRNYAPVTPVKNSPPATAVTATQKLCSTSAPSAPVIPTNTLGAPEILTPVCEDTHYVTVRGTYVNSIVVLFRNGAIAGMAGGVLGDLKMALGGGAVWALGDEIDVVQYVDAIISGASAKVYANCAPQNVITQHNDNSRSGAALHETKLTPATVASANFIKLYTRQVDGDIVGQPLFVKGANTSAGIRNVFVVTTSKNNVYAFDADNLAPGPAVAPVWSRNLCSSSKSGVCTETYSQVVGITSTPVIDASTQIIYVVANCTPEGSPIEPNLNNGTIRIYAMNLKDGSDHVAPVTITAADPTTPSAKFDPHCQRNRPGLLLLNGVVYIAFATFSCDVGCKSSPYHGWVLGYRASDLKQTAVYCTSPTGNGVGIWQTGNGLAASDDGSIYFETGNGQSDIENSFVKLTVSGGGALSKAGSFTPNNAAVAVAPGERSLDDGDTDLGSGGPLLLPQGRLIGGGKQGRYYVLDQATMKLSQNSSPDSSGFDGFQAFMNTYHLMDALHTVPCAPAGGAAGCTITPSCFIDPKHYGDGELCGPNIHGGPIYWQVDKAHGFIYEMPEKDFLKGFRYDMASKHVTTSPALTATGSLAKPPTDGMPGGYSSLSANGAKYGVVWTSMPNGDAQWVLRPGRLAAFDALSLKQIWSDPDNYSFAKAVPPTVADGKIIRATGSQPTGAPADFRLVAVYGLGPNAVRPAPGFGTSAGAGAPGTGLAAGACYSIQEAYANYGGSLGILGMPVNQEVRSAAQTSACQDFRGQLFGMTSMNSSIRDPEHEHVPTCSMPEGKTTEVMSSVYWTPKTCAHVVMGEIRDYWLRLGGPKSKFGYPVSDETYTPDHRGRMSRFEHGEIWWYADKGAYENTPKGSTAASQR